MREHGKSSVALSIRSSLTHLRLPATRSSWAIVAICSLVFLLVLLILLTPAGRLFPTSFLTRDDVARLPQFNAILNGASALLLLAGFFFIRRRQIMRHRLCMTTALLLSALFLLSYVIYHAVAGSTEFAGAGWMRPVYFAILISHIVLAVLILPLALTTFYRAYRRRFVQHRRLARWTFPIWLYVSASGVVIYLLLYHYPLPI